MNQEIIKAFEAVKDDIRSELSMRIAENKNNTFCLDITYDVLLEISFKYINKYLDEHYDYSYNIDAMTIVDNGDYQGSLIFIIPLDTYQPNIYETYYTYVYYGSCSGCDTLMGILYGYDDIKIKLNDLMTLILHMLQHFEPIKREEE